ncbi:MAG TPA: C4-type zinc ribbon domain-containing protein [Thermoanaerobaculia bacterium]|nr:C4-type zinc ribbon domain-containing protein [Thermoanaerobaculia bacterium]
MTGEIENLIRLQELFLLQKSKTRQRETLPPELADVDREYREKLAAIETLKATIEDADRSRRVAEGKLSELTEKQKKYQAQLMAVKNSREYGAMLNEIDQVKRELREVEDEVVGFMETIESARAELGERETNLPAETEAHEQQLSGWRETQRAIDREIEDVKIRTAEIEKTFTPKKLAEFYRLCDRKGGHAVVRAVGGSCSACHVRLRPALYQALRVGSEVVTCDSCKRILYYQDDAAASS